MTAGHTPSACRGGERTGVRAVRAVRAVVPARADVYRRVFMRTAGGFGWTDPWNGFETEEFEP